MGHVIGLGDKILSLNKNFKNIIKIKITRRMNFVNVIKSLHLLPLKLNVYLLQFEITRIFLNQPF